MRDIGPNSARIMYMKVIIRFTVVIAAVMAAVPALGEDLPEADCRAALEIMFAGRPADAAAFIDSLEGDFGEGPLYRLTRARIYREVLPVDDENKERLKEMAEPIYADLDHVIAYCDRRLDKGDKEPRLLLYRGWAWMFKSHIRTFERSFWSAGRDAKKGRNDLRDYLEIRPDDPFANGIMGTFLYFADTLPAAFKFISKLLFMPTGDREEGLRMMIQSCEHPKPHRSGQQNAAVLGVHRLRRALRRRAARIQATPAPLPRLSLVRAPVRADPAVFAA